MNEYVPTDGSLEAPKASQASEYTPITAASSVMILASSDLITKSALPWADKAKLILVTFDEMDLKSKYIEQKRVLLDPFTQTSLAAPVLLRQHEQKNNKSSNMRLKNLQFRKYTI